MTGFNVNVFQFLNFGMGFLELLLFLASAGICMYYNRLSTWMFLMAVGFAGLGFAGVVGYGMYLLPFNGGVELFMIVGTISRLAALASSALVAVGLLLVLRDLKSRCEFMVIMRQEGSAAVPSEPVFQPKGQS